MLLQMRNYKDYNNDKDLSSYQISIVSFVWVKVSNNFYDIMIWFLDPIQVGTFPLSTLPPPPIHYLGMWMFDKYLNYTKGPSNFANISNFSTKPQKFTRIKQY